MPAIAQRLPSPAAGGLGPRTAPTSVLRPKCFTRQSAQQSRSLGYPSPERPTLAKACHTTFAIETGLLPCPHQEKLGEIAPISVVEPVERVEHWLHDPFVQTIEKAFNELRRTKSALKKVAIGGKCCERAASRRRGKFGVPNFLEQILERKFGVAEIVEWLLVLAANVGRRTYARPPGFSTRCSSRITFSGSETCSRICFVVTTVSNVSFAKGSACASSVGLPSRIKRSRQKSIATSQAPLNNRPP